MRKIIAFTLVFFFFVCSSKALVPDGTAGSILPYLKILSETASGDFQASEMNYDKWFGLGYVSGLIKGVTQLTQELQGNNTLKKDMDINIGNNGIRAMIAYNYFKEHPELLSKSDGTLMLEAFIMAIYKKNSE